MDMDGAIQHILTILNKSAQIRHKLKAKKRWSKDEPLRLLLVGYTGAKNTGSDLRTAEMVRQFYHLLQGTPLQLTVGTLNPAFTRDYFHNANQVLIPQIFLRFISKECPKYDGIIACEGSMFKSKFATVLSTFMASALGVANAEEKLSVGYGAEAGEMGEALKRFVSKQCKKSLIICRNEQSRHILHSLDIRTSAGTDTGWTFNPAPSARGKALLRQAGWDEKKPVLAIAPINPFWWPVTPSLTKTAVNWVSRKYRDSHYQSIYFHQYDAQDKAKYERYLTGMAKGVAAFCQRHDVFPILIGMELLDQHACAALSQKLGGNIPQFLSRDYHMFDLVSILRGANLLLSSRFHAIVTTMPAGIPSAGVTMDERIHNLMEHRDHLSLLLKTSEPDLAAKVTTVLEALHQNREQFSKEIQKNVATHLQSMGEMGKVFLNEVQRIYPQINTPNFSSSWEAYLPPLSADLQKLLEGYH